MFPSLRTPGISRAHAFTPASRLCYTVLKGRRNIGARTGNEGGLKFDVET